MKNLLFAILLLPLFAIAQETTPYIEIVGTASSKVEPNFITAEVVISSSLYYDNYNEKEISKFENSMRKAAAKLNLESYLEHKNQFLGACTSFEKEFKLEFNSIAEYERVMEAVEDADYDDLYIDWYLNDYEVSDEQKKAATASLFQDALLDAKSKAEVAAKTLDFTIGDVLQIEERDSFYDDSYDDYYYDDYGYDDYNTPSSIEVKKSFYVRFEIK